MFRLNLGTTKIPHNKNTADMKPVRMPPPKEVLLPLSQNIGVPAFPRVKVGDYVKVGQLVAEADEPLSSPIYASVSGTVTKIEDYLRSDGKTVPAIRIESDGLMTLFADITPPILTDAYSFVETIESSGVVGFGGAGFPTAVKMTIAPENTVHTIILNGAECEPYITVDTRTMLEDAESLQIGINLLKKYIPGVKNFIIAIEKNKPSCIAHMKRFFAHDPMVSVKALPSLYPQGAEKVLIRTTTKITVPEGKLPADVGVLVMNVTTLAALGKYIKTGMPLVEKCVTVDGSAVNKPQNVIVPLGTPIGDVIEFAGGLKETPVKVIIGGPMTGSAAYSLNEPVIKTTGAILAFSNKEAGEKSATACIHCGKCVEACPILLEPTAFCKALDINDRDEKLARLERLRINLCVECGCCSYVCPANRPLVESNRIAKNFVREYKAHKEKLK